MTDLISRAAAIKALEAVSARPSSISEIHDLPTIKPQVVANITGGMLQGASSDYPVDIYVLDFDVWDADRSSMIEVDGSEATFGQISADVDPDFVKRVIEADTLDTCGQCEGTGTTDAMGHEEMCPVCDGTGVLSE